MRYIRPREYFWRANLNEGSRKTEMSSASGRGRFYGSLHPAYQPFNIHADSPVHGNIMSGPPAIATSSADSVKLDKILSLLDSQQQQITTLTSEVSV